MALDEIKWPSDDEKGHSTNARRQLCITKGQKGKEIKEAKGRETHRTKLTEIHLEPTPYWISRHQLASSISSCQVKSWVPPDHPGIVPTKKGHKASLLGQIIRRILLDHPGIVPTK